MLLPYELMEFCRGKLFAVFEVVVQWQKSIHVLHVFAVLKFSEHCGLTILILDLLVLPRYFSFLVSVTVSTLVTY